MLAVGLGRINGEGSVHIGAKLRKYENDVTSEVFGNQNKDQSSLLSERDAKRVRMTANKRREGCTRPDLTKIAGSYATDKRM